MRLVVVRSFSARVGGESRRYSEGDILEVRDMPEGVDWLNAGLVAPIVSAPEMAIREAPEQAVARKKSTTTRRRKAK